MRPAVLDDRLHVVLVAIVESYIETAEPVGSRTLSRSLELGLSPATLRNLMADLTDQGYLEQPHTSAGRVPTNRAYRHYVATCTGEAALPEEVGAVVRRTLHDSAMGLTNLLDCTSHLLAELTQFTGVAASPRLGRSRLRLIEFLKLSEHSIYAVVITQSNMVYHRLLETSEDLTQEFLNSVSRYLNEQFARRSLAEVRQQVQDTLLEEKATYDQFLAHAVRLSKKALDLSEERELYVEGVSRIVHDFPNVARVQQLLEALEHKTELISYLDAGMNNLGVTVDVGPRHDGLAWEDCAVIAARYGNGDTALGSIAVVGPTRMNYLRVVPIVDYTAQVLSEVIASH